MAHYAKVLDGIVQQVIVAEPEFFNTFVDSSPGEWLKTSYNVKGGIYYDPDTRLPVENQADAISKDIGRQRKNYASVGYTYDSLKNAFIPPQPFPSWLLNEETCLWDPPTPYPDDGEDYYWDEESTSWQIVSPPEDPPM